MRLNAPGLLLLPLLCCRGRGGSATATAPPPFVPPYAVLNLSSYAGLVHPTWARASVAPTAYAHWMHNNIPLLDYPGQSRRALGEPYQLEAVLGGPRGAVGQRSQRPSWRWLCVRVRDCV